MVGSILLDIFVISIAIELFEEAHDYKFSSSNLKSATNLFSFSFILF